MIKKKKNSVGRGAQARSPRLRRLTLQLSGEEGLFSKKLSKDSVFNSKFTFPLVLPQSTTAKESPEEKSLEGRQLQPDVAQTTYAQVQGDREEKSFLFAAAPGVRAGFRNTCPVRALPGCSAVPQVGYR